MKENTVNESQSLLTTKKESESLEFHGNNRLDGFHTDSPSYLGRGLGG